MHPSRSWREPPRVVGHRGAAAEAPENTLAAFRAALDAGVAAVELDVQLTADGVPVVLHDDTLDRTTTGGGPLAERTLEEVRSLDAGVWFSEAFRGERVPTLEEVLDLLRGRALVNLELKTSERTYPGLEEKVGRLIRDRGMRDHAVATTFNPETLARWRDVNPDITCGAILLGDPDGLDLDEYGPVSAYGVHFDCCHREFVERAHAGGCAVYAWTVNDADRARNLLDLGVDGVITDDPRDMLAALGPGATARGP